MKGYEKVKEILKSELDDYSYFNYGEIKVDKCYDQTEEDEYYEVEVGKGVDKKVILCFHYSKEEDKMEILLGEDTFEEITTYDWRVKYFWMALLKW